MKITKEDLIRAVEATVDAEEGRAKAELAQRRVAQAPARVRAGGERGAALDRAVGLEPQHADVPAWQPCVWLAPWPRRSAPSCGPK